MVVYIEDTEESTNNKLASKLNKRSIYKNQFYLYMLEKTENEIH